MINFNLVFHSLNLKFQNSKKQALCGLLQSGNNQKKFSQKRIKTVGGVAFEIFTRFWVDINLEDDIPSN